MFIESQTTSISPSMSIQNQTTSTSDSSDDFSSLMSTLSQVDKQSTKTKREQEIEEQKAAIESFFKQMAADGGALQYVIKSNQEKIDKLVEQKENELIASSGLDRSNPPLTQDQKAKILSDIAQEVSEYKKELLKQLDEKAKEEKKSHDTQQPNSSSLSEYIGQLLS